MIISETYFKGIIDIDYSKASTKEEIRYYSESVSEIYLKLLLGHTQYNDYVANKTAEKYVNLIKAETFTYNEETYANDIKQMLAYFLYVELTQDSQSYNTTMGEMSSTTDNAARNLSVRKLQRAWNLGVDLYRVAQLYLLANAELFPNCKTTDLQSMNMFGI